MAEWVGVWTDQEERLGVAGGGCKPAWTPWGRWQVDTLSMHGVW